VQFYERYQDDQAERFRVLLVTTGGAERLNHMLGCAAQLARNPRRSLVYGITLRDLLAHEHSVSSPCFQNHHGQVVALVPRPPVVVRAFQLTRPPAMIPSASCLRSAPQV
jgi:hypothetical protein